MDTPEAGFRGRVDIRTYVRARARARACVCVCVCRGKDERVVKEYE